MDALETKLEQLKLAVTRTDSIIALNNEVAMERHLNAIKALTMEADSIKRAVEEQKIAAKDDPEELNQWNSSVDTNIFAADESGKILKHNLEEFRQRTELKKHEKALDFEQKMFEAKMKFLTELQLAKEKGEGRQNQTTDGASVSGHELPAKLLKLQIACFNSTYEDWPKFWNQFVEVIDKATMLGVTKFAYLKSFLDQKVKHSIEGLPFSSKGYNRAKSILLDKYEKDSEIIKAYTQQIFDLPFIPNQNLHRIHDFCDKLMFSVQSLQTMGKLEQVNGYVAMTLDKLPGIRGDLVRTDPSWENWTFDKLTEALRLWTRRNPSLNKMTDISKMRETAAMTGREISPHLECSTRNKEMVHARHLACTATRQSIGPSTAPMLLMWQKEGQSFFKRGCASIVPALIGLKIVAAKWHARNAERNTTRQFVTAIKGLKDC